MNFEKLYDIVSDGYGRVFDTVKATGKTTALEECWKNHPDKFTEIVKRFPQPYLIGTDNVHYIAIAIQR